jgi:hypothetical protein
VFKILVTTSKAEGCLDHTYSRIATTSISKIKEAAVAEVTKVLGKTTTTSKILEVEGVTTKIDPHLLQRTNTRSKDATIFATENFSTLWVENSFNLSKINLDSRCKGSSVLLKWQQTTPTTKLWSSHSTNNQSP